MIQSINRYSYLYLGSGLCFLVKYYLTFFYVCLNL